MHEIPIVLENSIVVDRFALLFGNDDGPLKQSVNLVQAIQALKVGKSGAGAMFASVILIGSSGNLSARLENSIGLGLTVDRAGTLS